MKTKIKIIEAAIKLFNESGLVNVRLQNIADEAGISTGNLTYHFANKASIVEATYKKLSIELSELAIDSRAFSNGKEALNIIADFFKFQQKYRFFYLDTIEILRAYPTIKKMHRSHLETGLEVMIAAIKMGNETGYLKDEPAPGIYKSLGHLCWQTLNLWLTQNELNINQSKSGMLSMANLFYPYLTEKGIEHYHLVLAEHEFLEKSVGTEKEN